MDATPAVERRQHQESALTRLQAQAISFALGLWRLTLLAMILAPVILLSLLTIDVPFRAIDHFFRSESLRPGNWLTVGVFVMTLGPMLSVLQARRYGGDEASRAVTLAWALSAIAVMAEFTYLAPELEAGDLPSVRFAIGFAAAGMTGQFVAIGLYDVLRGGGPWWRAPLYALLIGYAVHVVLFYAIGYGASQAPWMHWMVTDFGVKAASSVVFLVIYMTLRKALRPSGGLGG